MTITDGCHGAVVSLTAFIVLITAIFHVQIFILLSLTYKIYNIWLLCLIEMMTNTSNKETKETDENTIGWVFSHSSIMLVR